MSKVVYREDVKKSLIGNVDGFGLLYEDLSDDGVGGDAIELTDKGNEIVDWVVYLLKENNLQWEEKLKDYNFLGKCMDRAALDAQRIVQVPADSGDN